MVWGTTQDAVRDSALLTYGGAGSSFVQECAFSPGVTPTLPAVATVCSTCWPKLGSDGASDPFAAVPEDFDECFRDTMNKNSAAQWLAMMETPTGTPTTLGSGPTMESSSTPAVSPNDDIANCEATCMAESTCASAEALVAWGETSYATDNAAFGKSSVEPLHNQTAVRASPVDACSTVDRNVQGKVAVVERGACDFWIKARNAEIAGAVAVIIINNGSPPMRGTMSCSDATQCKNLMALSVFMELDSGGSELMQATEGGVSTLISVVCPDGPPATTQPPRFEKQTCAAECFFESQCNQGGAEVCFLGECASCHASSDCAGACAGCATAAMCAPCYLGCMDGASIEERQRQLTATSNTAAATPPLHTTASLPAPKPRQEERCETECPDAVHQQCIQGGAGVCFLGECAFCHASPNCTGGCADCSLAPSCAPCFLGCMNGASIAERQRQLTVTRTTTPAPAIHTTATPAAPTPLQDGRCAAACPDNVYQQCNQAGATVCFVGQCASCHASSDCAGACAECTAAAVCAPCYIGCMGGASIEERQRQLSTISDTAAATPPVHTTAALSPDKPRQENRCETECPDAVHQQCIQGGARVCFLGECAFCHASPNCTGGCADCSLAPPCAPCFLGCMNGASIAERQRQLTTTSTAAVLATTTASPTITTTTDHGRVRARRSHVISGGACDSDVNCNRGLGCCSGVCLPKCATSAAPSPLQEDRCAAECPDAVHQQCNQAGAAVCFVGQCASCHASSNCAGACAGCTAAAVCAPCYLGCMDGASIEERQRQLTATSNTAAATPPRHTTAFLPAPTPRQEEKCETECPDAVHQQCIQGGARVCFLGECAFCHASPNCTGGCADCSLAPPCAPCFLGCMNGASIEEHRQRMLQSREATTQRILATTALPLQRTPSPLRQSCRDQCARKASTPPSFSNSTVAPPAMTAHSGETHLSVQTFAVHKMRCESECLTPLEEQCRRGGHCFLGGCAFCGASLNCTGFCQSCALATHCAPCYLGCLHGKSIAEQYQQLSQTLGSQPVHNCTTQPVTGFADPSTALRGQKLPYIYCMGKQLHRVPKIADRSFAGALHLENNLIAILTREDFAQVPRLIVLVLSNNKITSLGAHTFADLTELYQLRISYNPLSNLSPFAFTGLASLGDLRSDHGSLRELPASVFVPLASLTIMELFYQPLTSEGIGSRGLHGLHALESMLMIHNSISVLSKAMFRDLGSLRGLQLEFNRIAVIHDHTFANMRSLVNLRLQFNDISKLPEFAFSGLLYLRKLDLSHNNLTELETRVFSNLVGDQEQAVADGLVPNVKLNILFLDNNNIASIVHHNDSSAAAKVGERVRDQFRMEGNVLYVKMCNTVPLFQNGANKSRCVMRLSPSTVRHRCWV